MRADRITYEQKRILDVLLPTVEVPMSDLTPEYRQFACVVYLEYIEGLVRNGITDKNLLDRLDHLKRMIKGEDLLQDF